MIIYPSNVWEVLLQNFVVVWCEKVVEHPENRNFAWCEWWNEIDITHMLSGYGISAAVNIVSIKYI